MCFLTRPRRWLNIYIYHSQEPTQDPFWVLFKSQKLFSGLSNVYSWKLNTWRTINLLEYLSCVFFSLPFLIYISWFFQEPHSCSKNLFSIYLTVYFRIKNLTLVNFRNENLTLVYFPFRKSKYWPNNPIIGLYWQAPLFMHAKNHRYSLKWISHFSPSDWYIN